MSDAAKSRKALSALIALATFWTAFLGVLAVVPQPARAASCDQVSVISGTWTVTNTQECVGIDFTLDGNLNISAGGSLTLRGGSLSVIQDTSRIYSVNVAAGGTLILDGATLKTTPQSLNAYVKLDFNVNGGTFRLINGGVMKFPGTFDTTAGSTVDIRDSTITGFFTSDVEPWVGIGAPANDNDDAPTITWTSSTVSVFNSTIQRMYEAIGADPARTPLYLAGTTTLTAINSYIGVDFHSDPNLHNVIQASSSARAFLLNVTTDDAQSNLINPSNWIPAYVPVGGGIVYLYRWAHLTVVDHNGVPVGGAGVWTRQTPNGATATYPDNAGGTAPGGTILSYLGKTAANFNVTDEDGNAWIPLLTDRIDTGTGRNSFFSGNYQQTASFGGFSGTSACTFSAYPIITADSNTNGVANQIAGLVLPRPEFSITGLTFSGGNGQSPLQPLNTPVTIVATLNNSGPLGATGVTVSFFRANVDADADGVIDSAVATYKSTGLWIGEAVVDIAPATSLVVTLPWTPPEGIAETNIPVSAMADPPLSTLTGHGAIVEPNETNNIRSTQIALFTWPDLSVLDARLQRDPVVDNPTPIDVMVENIGTNTASQATIQIFDGVGSVTSVPFDLPRGSQATRVVTWTPSVIGLQTIRVTISSKNETGVFRSRDYKWTNNVLFAPESVLSQPDLKVLDSDYTGIVNVTQNRPFDFAVVIHNAGQTDASGVDVAVYLDGNLATPLNYTSRLGVPVGVNLTVILHVAGIDAPTGLHNLTVVVDPNHQINEGSAAAEANNFANATIRILPPAGALFLDLLRSTTLESGTTLLISGVVVDTSSAPLRGIGVTVTLEDPIGNVASTAVGTSGADGTWTAQLTIPSGLREGGYRIVARGPTGGAIAPATIDVSVKSNLPFLFQPVPLIGIPWWLLLAIIVIVAGVGIGVTVYFKVYGLGKMVECGECGAFIPEDSRACPKCGVEFEKEMAKCSNCQAWIPVDVKQCPECGVEFATGEVEMADYQEKMRIQYDEVARKFQDEASRQIGRPITDNEFQAWWRKQPTFVTFEDWLREEEEMRKMGSKPCPACGTLNSVTATVCHKCGTFLKEEKRASTREVPKRMTQSGQGATGGEAEGSDATGAEPVKRVARKPSTGSPVVRKVIRRVGEPGEGEQSQDRGGKSGDDET